jgi:hypothetical protein
MAKSKAQKLREKLAREGKLNPSSKRLTNNDYSDISQHVRVVENKKVYTRNKKHKSRNYLSNDNYSSDFYYFQALSEY